MLKYRLLILLLFLGATTAFAQAIPIYFNGNRVTTDKERATSYGVYGKLSGEDLWVLKRYDLDDNLLFSGAYKDEQLTKPHGKFIFYGSIFDYNYQNFSNFKNETTDRYVTQQGEYVDGLEQGKWTDYFPDGRIMGYRNYVNGKLEGETAFFNYKGRRMLVGHYKGGLRVGTWYDLKKKIKEVFEDDKLISTTKLKKAEILEIE
jgi:antitoxin component YwqK of YwqJK toxin-antitoxin module